VNLLRRWLYLLANTRIQETKDIGQPHELETSESQKTLESQESDEPQDGQDSLLNIERAKHILQQWMMIRASISLKVREGTDVFDLPKMIFEAADRKSLHLPTTSLYIIIQLRRKAPQHLEEERS
jgi:hypothetical protein